MRAPQPGHTGESARPVCHDPPRAVTFFLADIALCRLMPEFQGVVRWALMSGVVGIACFLAFLITVDVPMYLSRWRAGHAEGNGVPRVFRGPA